MLMISHDTKQSSTRDTAQHHRPNKSVVAYQVGEDISPLMRIGTRWMHVQLAGLYCPDYSDYTTKIGFLQNRNDLNQKHARH